MHYGNTQPNPLESKVWLQTNGQLKTYDSHGKQWRNIEVVPPTEEKPDEITFNAWVIVSAGVGLGVKQENQTFTALDGMTWKEYIDSEYGQDSPFFYYEGDGVFINNGDAFFQQDFGIFLDETRVSENDKIIANAQYDNGARNV